MKKTKSVIGMLALVLLFSSAFNPVETGLKEGKQAPKLYVENTAGKVTLQELKGQYVLLNFWAGYDAMSRMQNVRFAREIDKAGLENISLVSVSFDTNRKVFEETIKRDGLNAATQFYDKDGSRSDIFDNYRLNKGFASYLISPEGVIIAKNPDPEHLTNLIRQ
ncbi:MAG TPA: peroxiredoxin family protein [Candidatus Barnesiella excrementigallinarum]|nr:peroxiredoxin family protein [Candidatus Barnesiella excrementigallinarum]